MTLQKTVSEKIGRSLTASILAVGGVFGTTLSGCMTTPNNQPNPTGAGAGSEALNFFGGIILGGIGGGSPLSPNEQLGALVLGGGMKSMGSAVKAEERYKESKSLVDRVNTPYNVQTQQVTGISKGKLNKVWIDYDAIKEGEKGIFINVDANFYNLTPYSPLTAWSYFYRDTFPTIPPIKDLDKRYATGSGNAATAKNFSNENYVNANCKVVMFMPYSQFESLPKSEKTNLLMEVKLFNGQYMLTKSDFIRFWVKI